MRLFPAFWWWSCCLGSSAGAGAGAGAGSETAAPPAYDVLDFDWSTITPGAKLKWHACYGDGEFQCARLLVPLDWTTDNKTTTTNLVAAGDQDDDDDNVTANATATIAIAMIKLPATVPDDDPSFGGTIFTNPGGPGGSGVRLALADAHVMRDIADRPGSGEEEEEDDDDESKGIGKGGRHYEILSWDPRGVLFTTPQVDCFDGDLAARYAADLQRRAMGSLDGGLDVVRRQHARARGLGQLCARGGARRNGSSEPQQQRSILPFLSTASVARDMVEMVDRIHELRREEAASASAADRPISGASEEEGSQKTMIELRGETQEKKKEARDGDLPRIQYWGFSYGSLLGNTFASMYPERVGRMIDGIVDTDDYMGGTWLTNLQDTEKIVDYFYSTCFSAGAERCPLRRPSDATAADMKARVDALVRSLNEQPAVVVLPSDDDYDGFGRKQQQKQHASATIITGYEILSAFRRPVYAPLQTFPPLARALASAVDHSNYTLILESQFRKTPDDSDMFCQSPGSGGGENNRSTTVMTLSEPDAAHAILCGDGGDATAHLGPDGLQAYVEALRRQSPTLGPYWATIRFECAGWTVRPRWRFTGPFGTPSHIGDDDRGTENHRDERGENGTEGGKGRPSAPLLFATSRLDPVTPRRNAYAMAAAHAGAAVLEVDAVGHCGSTVPSRCARAVIREYLEFGRVPVPPIVMPPPEDGNGTNITTIRCAADGFDPWAPEEGPEEGEEGIGKRGGSRRRPVDLQAAWPEFWV